MTYKVETIGSIFFMFMGILSAFVWYSGVVFSAYPIFCSLGFIFSMFFIGLEIGCLLYINCMNKRQKNANTY
jgi:hypothetical protein